MKMTFLHFRIYLFRGVIALIPIVLTWFAVRFLIVTIDKRVLNILDDFLGFRFPGIGLVVALCTIYLIGIAASNIAGRSFFNILDSVMNRIPLLKTTYNIGKQLGQTLTLPEGQVFKRAVLVEYLKPGMWTLGFVTGRVKVTGQSEEDLLKVFISTAPNPTTGMFLLVRESQIRDPGWSVQEALRIVISGGILGPDRIDMTSSGKPA